MMIKNSKRFLCVLCVILCLCTSGCRENVTEYSEIVEVVTTVVTTSTDETKEFKDKSDAIKQNEKNIVKVTVSPVNTEVLSQTKVQLPVKCILQNPQLPTGCEITSLTMVLNYYGFDAEKEEMAAKYLKKQGAPADFRKVFVGDPTKSYGFGCYAQPITDAANKYFKEKGIDYTAYNRSGREFEDLLLETEKGNPVLIWGTMGMKTPYYTYAWEVNGEKIQWIAPEHCLVLVGYDLERDAAILCDPQRGLMGYPLNIVKKRYAALYSQCVIIEKN